MNEDARTAEEAPESARELVVGLESRDGTIEVGWNLSAIAMLGGAEPTREAIWRADPVPAPGAVLRVLSARFADGRALLLAGLRPYGARSHADELIAGAVLGDAGGIEPLDRVLWSTEYDAEGATRRISIEAELGDEAMLRAAGDRRGDSAEAGTGDGLERVALDLSSSGAGGVGLLETVAPPR
ncbi:hypothetical protein HJD18_04985 [Thermoleophilia bacterium SCSIO 60948]|nr:hypothetical protein HJD18_04985 [Thermoleophilia bacterium SCSIO 60948]